MLGLRRSKLNKDEKNNLDYFIEKKNHIFNGNCHGEPPTQTHRKFLFENHRSITQIRVFIKSRVTHEKNVYIVYHRPSQKSDYSQKLDKKLIHIHV